MVVMEMMLDGEVNEAWKEVTKEVGRSVGNVGVIKIHLCDSDSRSCWEGHDHDCEFVFVYLYPCICICVYLSMHLCSN